MTDQIKPTRATRRVLLVLLTGDPGLDGPAIRHLAGINSLRAYGTIHRLERAGWVEGRWEGWADMESRHRLYQLTRQGRAKTIGLLGLKASDG